MRERECHGACVCVPGCVRGPWHRYCVTGWHIDSTDDIIDMAMHQPPPPSKGFFWYIIPEAKRKRTLLAKHHRDPQGVAFLKGRPLPPGFLNRAWHHDAKKSEDSEHHPGKGGVLAMIQTGKGNVEQTFTPMCLHKSANLNLSGLFTSSKRFS